MIDLQQRLLTLAARLDNLALDTDADEIARDLREIADRHPVQLPAIDPDRDDIAHWRGIDDRRLRNENGADAWNLAAGLYVERERAARRDAARAELADLTAKRGAS